MTINPPEHLMKLARTRAGVLTKAELREYAPHPKVLRRWITGWTPLAPGYYSITEPTWESWCWAGLLRAGATGVLSGAASGYLHGFVAEPPQRVLVFYEGPRPLTSLEGEQTHVAFRRGQRTARGALRRTPVEIALLDFARDADENGMIMALARALTQGLTTRERVLEALASRERVRHRRVAEEVCAQAAAGVESVPEWRFLRLVLHAHGLPMPTRQASVVEGSRSDNVWEEFGLLVELDGQLGHEEWFRDMRRDNRAALKGYTTLRYGWHDVLERPCEVAAEIIAVLRARGWQGCASACSRGGLDVHCGL